MASICATFVLLYCCTLQVQIMGRLG